MEYQRKNYDLLFDLWCWALPFYFFLTRDLVHVQILCVGFNYWRRWKGDPEKRERGRIAVALILLLTSFLSTPLVGENLPPTPKGIRLFNDRIGESSSRLFTWKMTKEEIKTITGDSLICLPSDTTPKMETCVLGSTRLERTHWYADVGGGKRFTTGVDLYKDKFFRATVTFDEGEFSFFYNTLKSSLGSPTTEKDLIVENRMGARFDNKLAVWTFDGEANESIVVVLQQRSGRIDTGALTMYIASIEIEANLASNQAGKSPF